MRYGILLGFAVRDVVTGGDHTALEESRRVEELVLARCPELVAHSRAIVAVQDAPHDGPMEARG